jgi:glucosyl-3-phosphoglycerate synthase
VSSFHLCTAADATALARAKAAAGLTVSVCIPARDEEATIGGIVAAVRHDLMEETSLVDEIVVIDDESLDATAGIAHREGAQVLAAKSLLPALPSGSGKGNALWKSLYASDGDLLCFLDADVRNFGSHFVTSLLAPLFGDASVAMVKAFYRRPLHGEPTGGGRVTELMARPLLSHLFPALTRFLQPLAGECAARREVLETVPFVQGWGVEVGLLIDIVRQFGPAAVAQVDLGRREHRNRPITDLGPQALAVLVTALRRAGLERDAGGTRAVAELVRFGDSLVPERVAVEVDERPSMLTVPEYRAKFGRELSA